MPGCDGRGTRRKERQANVAKADQPTSMSKMEKQANVQKKDRRELLLERPIDPDEIRDGLRALSPRR